MATATYTPLANTTLNSATNTVTFSSISQSYRDLVLIVNCTTSAVTNIFIHANNSYYSYAFVAIAGLGSGSGNGNWNNGDYEGLFASNYTNPDSTFPFFLKADIMDYSTTDKYKNLLIRDGGGFANFATQAMAARWSSTSAITELKITSGGNNFAAGSTFALYGIAA